MLGNHKEPSINFEKSQAESLEQQGQTVAKKVADAAIKAIDLSRQMPDRTKVKAREKVEGARMRFGPIVDDMSAVAASTVDKAREVFHDVSDQARVKAQKASDAAVFYTKDEPVRAILIAVVAGALLVAVASSLMRSRD